MPKYLDVLVAFATVGSFIIAFLDSYEVRFKIRRRARTVRDGKEQRSSKRKK